MLDDLGFDVPTQTPATRVVSLVPSLTEALAASRPDALVGATDWCIKPADLAVARVRGTKNPNISQIIDLQPDLVIANKEENRELDVSRLREAGLNVWVTDIETLDESFSSMRRLFEIALGWPVPDWLAEAERIWAEPAPQLELRVAVAIWRDPWMVVGRDTFTGDLLGRLGVKNHFDSSEGRYPHVELSNLDNVGVDLILLPDEPYEFSQTDGPEAFTNTKTVLCSGQALTWYGPALLTSRAEILAALSPGRTPN